MRQNLFTWESNPVAVRMPHNGTARSVLKLDIGFSQKLEMQEETRCGTNAGGNVCVWVCV